ncbi:hypothetical protein [Cylindrospermopsis raciborskii]|nr:hypothetical protein [Cylindrospermopsis raciborskii]
MCWIFPYLSVLKGNLSRSLSAIALGLLRKCSGYYHDLPILKGNL